MNDGARILLLDVEGNVSGGDRTADPRGGIFGSQGYGGGVFDGSTRLGGLGLLDTKETSAFVLPVLAGVGVAGILGAGWSLIMRDRATPTDALADAVGAMLVSVLPLVAAVSIARSAP